VDAQVAVAVEDLVVAAEVVVVEVRGEDVEAAVTGILGVVITVVDGVVCILTVELHQYMTLARNDTSIICLFGSIICTSNA
jgi:hypothetical protein